MPLLSLTVRLARLGRCAGLSVGVAFSAMLQVLGGLVDVPLQDFLRAVVTLTVDGEEMIASYASLLGSSLILGLPSEMSER